MKAVVCALVLMFGFVAQAAPASGHKHARKANTLAAAGKCKQAIPEYNAAYALLLDPALLFNRAECLRKLGLKDQALYDYRRFLKDMPEAPNRALVERRIATLDPTAKLPTPELAKAEEPTPELQTATLITAQPQASAQSKKEGDEAAPLLSREAGEGREGDPAPARTLALNTSPPPSTNPAPQLQLTQTPAPAPAKSAVSPWVWMSAAAAVVAAAALGAWYVTAHPSNP
jgi:tetratricopeptide (TPR) repeat protein